MARVLIIAFALAALAGQSVAQTTPPSSAPTLNVLGDCQKISDDAARLRCFDRAATNLVAASKAGDIVVVDREQMRSARRSLFGFSFPKPRIFGDRDETAEIKEIRSKVTRAASIGNGHYRVTIDHEAAVWESVESSQALRAPKTGDAVWIKKGALGSYFLQFGSQRWVKARRVK